MWIPESVHALEAAARAGSLYETPSFDGKKQLPDPQKNVSLAIDVAAMSTDGGVLLYGVGEGANKRLTVLAPFPLAGAADRVAQIVETSIMEPPHIEIHEYPTEKDPNVGYLLVLVPQSARAPHQVTVKGDLRFYGRGAKGNRVLTEGEIARLYARRVVWEQDRNELLEDAVRQSPFPNSERSVIGFARPVLPDPAIWDCAVAAAGDRDALHRELQAAAGWPQTATEYDPSFGRSVLEWHQLGSDDLRLSTVQEHQRVEGAPVYGLEASIRIDGSARLFSARATFEDQSTSVVRNVAMEFVIAGNFANFLNLVGKLYELAGYHGHVRRWSGCEWTHSSSVDHNTSGCDSARVLQRCRFPTHTASSGLRALRSASTRNPHVQAAVRVDHRRRRLQRVYLDTAAVSPIQALSRHPPTNKG